MSEYRYVVFPKGKQPTTAEVGDLQSFAGALANHFAWGTCRHKPRLAVAFDGRSFDHLVKIDAGFERLIGKWQARGCDVADHLAFVKDPTALRPISAAGHANDGRASVATLRVAEQLTAKELVAKEAIGRSLLAVEQTIQRYALVERIGTALPYAFMALAAAAVITAGFYIHHRLTNSPTETRQATIERLVKEPTEP
jgi:hypothetical protein